MSHPLQPRHILIADDDADDILLFQDALEQLLLPVQTTTVSNGEQLITALNEASDLPDIVFLDLNMPMQHGADCLSEIKESKKLQAVTVVVFSTSKDSSVIDRVYNDGAQYYICKPNNFAALKDVIEQVFSLSGGSGLSQPARDRFVLVPQMSIHGIK